jgi:apolipoprotein N-acyltransferase
MSTGNPEGCRYHGKLEACSTTLAFPHFFANLTPLKNLAAQILLRSRYPLAIAAGLLLAAAFPKIGIAGLAWAAPALILATAHGKTGADAFRIGYVAGLAQYLASLYWLLLIPVAGYPILGWLALSAYLALYPATWVWLLAKVPGAKCQVSGIPDPWARRTLWTLSGAAIWVALEMLVARLFSGFPCLLIGNSQFHLLPLIQIASVAGVYGVSFLVVWVSLSLFSAALAILRQPTQRQAWLGEIILPLAVLVAVFVFGFAKLREQTSDNPTLRVTFIQPSIPQTMIWDEKENATRFRQLLQLTTDALTNATDLILWPEAAVPEKIRYDEVTLRAVTGIAASNHVWMIVGSDDVEPGHNSTRPGDANYFNSSFLVSPDGALVARYCKRNLVIFGEYIPLVRWLPFVKWFTPITGGFTPGEKIVPFELERRAPPRHESDESAQRAEAVLGAPARIKTATLICFEDVFPHLVREYADSDTDFLVNLTNDGWFGEGAAQWQHAGSAVFRAVENGLPLLRCCNNGLTCWIDSRGRLQQIFRDETGSIYGAGVMTATIPTLPPGYKREPTFYNLHGDWFGWLCVAVAAPVLLARLSRLRQRRGEDR